MDLRRGEVDCNCLTLAETQLGLKGSVGLFEMSTFSRLLLLLFGASLADNETQGLSGPWQGPCARVISCPGWRLNSLPKVKVGVGRDGKWKRADQTSESTQVSKKMSTPKNASTKSWHWTYFTYFYIWSVLFVPRRIAWSSHSFNHEGLMMRSLCRKMGWSRTGWSFLDISGVGFLQHAFDMSELSKVVSTRLMRSYETIFRSKVFCLAFCAVS